MLMAANEKGAIRGHNRLYHYSAYCLIDGYIFNGLSSGLFQPIPFESANAAEELIICSAVFPRSVFHCSKLNCAKIVSFRLIMHNNGYKKVPCLRAVAVATLIDER